MRSVAVDLSRIGASCESVAVLSGCHRLLLDGKATEAGPSDGREQGFATWLADVLATAWEDDWNWIKVPWELAEAERTLVDGADGLGHMRQAGGEGVGILEFTGWRCLCNVC